MSGTCIPRVFEDGERYRVWSLTGQGFLKLTTKNENPRVECSGTGEEDSSIIIAKDTKKDTGPGMIGFWLYFQEKDKDRKTTYALFTDNGGVSVKEKSLQDPGEAEIFFVERFAYGTQGNGSVFKALRPLKSNETKCIALNGKKELSLKTFDKDIPHPDTIFLITKA